MMNVNALEMNELDFVIGGSMGETAKDSFELYDHGLLKDHWCPGSMAFNWKSLSAKVDAAWAKAGIQVISNPFGDNVYKKDGKRITRDDALKHLDDNFHFISVGSGKAYYGSSK